MSNRLAGYTEMMHQEFHDRLKRHEDELKWLYMELYDSPLYFEDLKFHMQDFYTDRNITLKTLDQKREKDPEWYKENDLLGMMLYADNFAGDLKGVKKQLDYIQKCQVNYIHLMPLLDTVKGRSDGGYAVKDFRKVQKELGTMKDLESLTSACHRRGISICLDFVMNHTSEEHEWAVKARAGEKKFQDRYFFFQDYSIPSKYEQTIPQVFPTTAPGNFTYLPECGQHVMTTFYPYQWDLNYRNPAVFNEMMYNFLYLANRGIDIIRIDAVPYIWKELGTSCRNLPQVHTIVRMMRMIGEIVCPSVLLLGEVVMEPEKVVPYFGTLEKPECHMLYNVTTMATIWHTVATKDIRLLKRQVDLLAGLPKEYVFLNYLRCHDDIGWGLDYEALKKWGMSEIPHKKFLNDFFSGQIPDSFSRGELYNDDQVTQDARACGTTASMCGIEKAGFEQDESAMKNAVRLDLMLHAFILALSGIPILYSGDEIAQVNDYSYKKDPLRSEDSRYLHRGKFRWDLVEQTDDESTVSGKIFQGILRLEKIRRQEKAFDARAEIWNIGTRDQSVIALGRKYEGESIIAVFNFFNEVKITEFEWETGRYRDLITGAVIESGGLLLPAYGVYGLKRI